MFLLRKYRKKPSTCFNGDEGVDSGLIELLRCSRRETAYNRLLATLTELEFRLPELVFSTRLLDKVDVAVGWVGLPQAFVAIGT